MSSPTTLSSRHQKQELPAWVQAYTQELRINAEDRAGLWPHDPLVPTLLAVADEIEARALAHALEELTLRDAAEESGYTRSHLKRLLRDQAIPNAGEGAPRLLRTQLPKKPSQRDAPPLPCSPLTSTQASRAIAQGVDI